MSEEILLSKHGTFFNCFENVSEQKILFSSQKRFSLSKEGFFQLKMELFQLKQDPLKLNTECFNAN